MASNRTRPTPSLSPLACAGQTPGSNAGATGGDPSTKAPAGFHLGYRRWLDGLRGLAILAVFAYHFRLLRGGFLGVDLFFVLSGFLITGLLVGEWQQRASISLGRFYLRRVLRLLPALLLLLLLGWLATHLFRPAEEKAYRKAMLVTACYLSNWPDLHGVNLGSLGHTWSLSVEEQFYVLWPVLLYGMLRGGVGRLWVILSVCLGIVASASWRAFLYYQHPASDPGWMNNVYRLYMGLDTRADALLIGCLIGLLAAWDLLPKSRLFLLGMTVAALVSALLMITMMACSRHQHRQIYCGFFTVFALLVAVILVRLLLAPSRLGTLVLEFPPLVAIGRISYGLYLFHLPILLWIAPEGPEGKVSTMLLVGSFTFLMAGLSYVCVERPCLRLKDRLRAFQSGRRSRPSTNAGMPSRAAA
jgi:peptidoglycan/LPS O-acetylase OafA/YrhL